MNSEVITHMADLMAEHEGVTHWAISQRIFGRGDVFSRLKEGRNCFSTTLERAHNWFGRNWPDDLT